jgi:hypothetical protein
MKRKSDRTPKAKPTHDRIVVFSGLSASDLELFVFPSSEYARQYCEGFNAGAGCNGYRAELLPDFVGSAKKWGAA